MELNANRDQFTEPRGPIENRSYWGDPGPTTGNQRFAARFGGRLGGSGDYMTIVGSLFGDQHARSNGDQAGHANSCPYSCDPIEAAGGPNLRSPYIALGGLVIFLAAMYLSNRGLERRPFGAQHIGCWLLAVIGGCLFTIATLPTMLGIIWPLI
jgi:hypothetical protein